MTVAGSSSTKCPWLKIIMIRKLTRRVTSQLRYAFCSGEGPKLYGSNKSILSLSQWWGGKLPHPVDYYIQDTLDTEVMEKWDVEKSIFRVVF